VLKPWAPGRPLQKFNRVDFELANTNYWIEAVILDIDQSNNQVLIKYRNNNRYKQIKEEWVDFDTKRISPFGLYTKYDISNNDKLNKSLSSSLSIPIKQLFAVSNNNNLLGKKNERDNIIISLNKQQELEFLNLMKKNFFEIRVVAGDGNCLFRAISDQVYGSEKYHDIIRKKCMDYIVVLKRFFCLFIEGDFDKYIETKRKSGCWGDDIELEAISEIYNRPIEIYSGSEKPLRCFHEDSSNNKNSGIEVTPIRISYHGKKHYNSVVPLKEDNNNYNNYKNNIIKTKPGIYEDKIIKIAKENEKDFDKGIKLSEDEYLEKLVKNLSGQKKEELLNQMILSLNKNKDQNDDDNESTNNEKNKKFRKTCEEKVGKEEVKQQVNEENEENKKIKKKDGKKDEKKDEKKDGKKDGKRDEKKDKKEEEIKDEIKDEKKDEIKDEKKDENKKNEDIKEDKGINEGLNDNNCDDIYLSNPVIKSALELGFDLNSVIEAWTICGDDKELVINYLLTENH
jgi:OTU domain-containing protein 5